MQRKALAVAVCALALSGCAGMDERAARKACEAPRDTMISVQDGEYPVVNQDPIYVCRQNIKLTWVLDPSQTSRFEFRDDSIVIRDPQGHGEFTNCKGGGNGGELGSNKDTIKCLDKKDKTSPPKRIYKYDIRIYQRGSPLGAAPVATYDPNIVND